MNTENDMLHFALDYARRGWPVFPCNPMMGLNAKGREINKTPLVEGGFHSATRDPEQIKAWWARWPNAMIGVPTGAASGVNAIDPDTPKKEEDEDGRKHGRCSSLSTVLLYTHTHLTPRGGKHVLFRHDPDCPLTNSTGGLKAQGSMCAGMVGTSLCLRAPELTERNTRLPTRSISSIFAPMPEWLYEYAVEGAGAKAIHLTARDRADACSADCQRF